MKDTTNDPYFDWLCKQVNIGTGHGRYYRRLARELHEIRFDTRNLMPMDKNRAYDGMNLRVRFMEKYGQFGSCVNRGPCTMLEFMVALAMRMDFLMRDESEDSRQDLYFMYMIRNLRLLKLEDSRFDILNGDFYVQEAAQRVLDRAYGENGEGGLFPLKKPQEDQRNVEIWYQMQAWLAEHCAIDIE